jgi:phosphatidylserine decarboxylase
MVVRKGDFIRVKLFTARRITGYVRRNYRCIPFSKCKCSVSCSQCVFPINKKTLVKVLHYTKTHEINIIITDWKTKHFFFSFQVFKYSICYYFAIDCSIVCSNEMKMFL